MGSNQKQGGELVLGVAWQHTCLQSVFVPSSLTAFGVMLEDLRCAYKRLVGCLSAALRLCRKKAGTGHAAGSMAGLRVKQSKAAASKPTSAAALKPKSKNIKA